VFVVVRRFISMIVDYRFWSPYPMHKSSATTLQTVQGVKYFDPIHSCYCDLTENLARRGSLDTSLAVNRNGPVVAVVELEVCRTWRLMAFSLALGWWVPNIRRRGS
jgi:hypothetical protein